MINLTHNSFLCDYFISLRVSSNIVLIIRTINFINTTSGICHSVSVTVSCVSDLHTKRPPTQSDIYQMYWYNRFTWWWARGCSKHVENWNKHVEKNCASIWSFTKNCICGNWRVSLRRQRHLLQTGMQVCSHVLFVHNKELQIKISSRQYFTLTHRVIASLRQ